MNKSRQRLLYSVSVLACALPLALSSSTLFKGNAEGLFDYSSENHVATLRGGDFLAKSGIELDQSEINYLNSYPEYSLSYSEAYLDDDVKTSLVGDSLYVFAHEKTYTDSNGRDWTWVPVSVESSSTKPFASFGDLYYVELENGTDINNVKINYELSLDIAPQVYNSFINKSYNDAVGLNEIYEQYLADENYYNRRPSSEEEYQSQLVEYNQYLEAYQAYLNKKENYEAYLASKAKYDEDLAKYNQYILDRQKYEMDSLAYKQNQEDWAYYLANHEQNLKEYNEFGIKYDNSRYQMEAMEIAYEDDTSQDRSMASYILSGTVSEVLSRKDELSALGVPTNLIEDADDSTVKLRTCLREYRYLSSDEARYSYYYINYHYIKSNANILLRSLERLIRYQSVRNVAQDRGKYPQFKTLIFQLIYFCNAISDKTVYNYEAYNPITDKGDMSKPGAAILDENYVFDGATYQTWLKGYTFLDTSKTATPASGIWPTQQVILIPEPETMSKPVEPAIVQKPVAPTPVNEPVAPSEVLKPIPYDPEALPPEYPAILNNELNAALLSAYRNNNVIEKEAFTESVEITLNGTREIAVDDCSTNVAIFHDYQGHPTQYVFFEDGVEYNGEVPFHPADEYYTAYYFNYWSDSSSTKVDLRTLNVSKKLYPVFDHGDPVLYDITWIYPDGTEQTKVISNSIPSAPRLPLKEETEDHYYVFAGWSPSLDEALSNETYTATFNEFDKYDISYEIDGNIVNERARENYLPNAPTSLELSSGTYYVITGWEEPLSVVTENAIYHATFEKYYTITWNILGEVSKERYLEGSTVSYKGNAPDPIRKETYYEQFEFDQDFGIANDNRTITATYVKHNYPDVVLKIDNLIINETGKYLQGDEVILPTNYSTDTDHYDITGWIQDGIYYVAKFEKTRYIGDDIYFAYVYDTLKVDASTKHLNEVNLNYLFSMMKEEVVEVTPIKLIFDDGEINLTASQVSYLVLRNAANISFEFTNKGNNSYTLKVVVTNTSGEEISIEDFYPEVTINEDIDYLHSQVYLDEEEVNAELSYGQARLRAQINQVYEILPTYSISVRASSAVEVSLSKYSGQPGEKVHLDYSVQKGYELTQFSVYTRAGNPVEIDHQNNFTLPDDDVIINFVCKKLQYTVELYVDNALYALYRVNYGDTIILPTYIKKVGTEDYEYLFMGWGVSAESITVTSDMVLRAEFTTVKREQKSEKQTSNAVKIVGYVAVGTLLGGLGVGLFFIFRKIRKH